MADTSARAETLEVRLLPIETLKPAPYNPRQRLRPSDPAYQKLAASLREFGLVEPLIWNETTGYVVGGHARLEILRSMGVQHVPVSVVHLDPAREKALNVVLNNREAQARFDTELLADLLTELEELPEFELTGFVETDLAALRLEPPPEPPAAEADPEHVEITLTTDPQTYQRLSSRLDSLIRKFDLECHVREW